MSSRDVDITLRQMLDHGREIVEMTRGRTREDLDSNRMLNLALVRLLEVIGEAASRVSPDDRRRHSEIPWTQLVGMRNRLIHAYDRVDFDILWAIVNREVPDLVRKLERMLSPR